MSRLGMFACLLMLVAVAICLDMPPNAKGVEPPKDGAKVDTSRLDPQMPPRPEGAPPRQDGRPEQPKPENPKGDAKPPQDAKS